MKVIFTAIRLPAMMGIVLLLGLTACQSKMERLEQAVIAELGKQQGVFAVAFMDLGTGEQLLINERETFHAASTMKTPVLIEVYKQDAEGVLDLSDSVLVRNEFKSIVDSSLYSLDPGDDSQQELYDAVNQKQTLYDLVYAMIIKSSNLATNRVIELVDAKNVTRTMRDLGAADIQVLRGVEDIKAYRQGLNNTTTAYDLMVIFQKIATGEAVNPEASREMTGILLDQQFNDIIPARLPEEAKVAHKTGWISGVRHDSGIVFLPDGRKYVLVLLSKELEDEDAGIEAMARVSELIYDYVSR